MCTKVNMRDDRLTSGYYHPIVDMIESEYTAWQKENILARIAFPLQTEGCMQPEADIPLHIQQQITQLNSNCIRSKSSSDQLEVLPIYINHNIDQSLGFYQTLYRQLGKSFLSSQCTCR